MLLLGLQVFSFSKYKTWYKNCFKLKIHYITVYYEFKYKVTTFVILNKFKILEKIKNLKIEYESILKVFH